MNNWTIYTDGSCRANKKGGVGIVLLKNGEKISEGNYSYEDVTNNIMELNAIKIALKSVISEIDSLEIITDSEYAIGCITNPTWHPKKNVALIGQIKELLVKTQKLVKTPIKITHIKGHSTDKWNNLADKLATEASSYL